ncbi:glycosyltransferase family 90 protein, partial [Tortispora caseinolytica NRRL Y-17796]
DPIQQLVVRGMLIYHKLARVEQPTLNELTTWYIKQYGRVPPPNFDKWYEYAKEKNIVDYRAFEQIYNDLKPFWGLSPNTIRASIQHLQQSPDFELVEIRDGKAVWPGGHEISFIHRANILRQAVDTYGGNVPDLDILLNTLDEPKVLCPLRDIAMYKKLEEETRFVHPSPKNEFTTTVKPATDPLYGPMIPFKWIEHHRRPAYDLLHGSCPADSLIAFPGTTEEIRKMSEELYLTEKGKFIFNTSASLDSCTIGPVARYNHGFFAAAISNKVLPDLVPVFTESKLNVHNDILSAPHMHFIDDSEFLFDPATEQSFESKSDIAVWRGYTSEGDARPDTWKYLQRHKLVDLFNASKVEENGMNKYHFMCDKEERRNHGVEDEPGMCVVDPTSYLEEYGDMAFVGQFGCEGEEMCDLERQHYAFVDRLPFNEILQHKYLFDVDGVTFSGRFMAFLNSNSLPFKSSVFNVWYQNRLVPWAHYIPIDVTMDEAFAAYVYFNGFKEHAPSRVALAAKLGKVGQEWTRRVLRKEDMQVYNYLLLLEYGRVLDDNRDQIGY